MASNHTVEGTSKLSFGLGFKIRFGVFINCHGEQALALEELSNTDCIIIIIISIIIRVIYVKPVREIYLIVLCERGKAASMLLLNYLVDDGASVFSSMIY